MTKPQNPMLWEAGRDLDAEIAVRILGWKEVDYRGQRCFEWPGWAEEVAKLPPCGARPGLLPAVLFDAPEWPALPAYSTDIALAWRVLEYLRSEHIFLGVHATADSFIVGDMLNNRGLVQEESAALAICKAALIAWFAAGRA